MECLKPYGLCIKWIYIIKGMENIWKKNNCCSINNCNNTKFWYVCICKYYRWIETAKKETEEKHTDIKEELSIELDAICELDAEISEYEKEIGQLEGKIEELNASIKIAK